MKNKTQADLLVEAVRIKFVQKICTAYLEAGRPYAGWSDDELDEEFASSFREAISEGEPGEALRRNEHVSAEIHLRGRSTEVAFSVAQYRELIRLAEANSHFVRAELRAELRELQERQPN